MKRRFPLALRLALLLGILVITSSCVTRRLTYPAPGMEVPAAPAPFKDVTLTLPSGKTAAAWSWESPSPRVPILFLHGNAENLETMRQAGWFEDMEKLGAPFLALDYPGYGRSEGTPSEAANVEAAEAAMAWLARRYPDRPCVVFGRSLGAGVAVQAAARHPQTVQALVLASPFSSLPDVARAHFPGWLVWILMRETYPSLETAPSIQVPALVIHGEADDVIPAAQGKRVAEALPRGRWVAVPGYGHNDLFEDPRVWQEVAGFLKALPR